MAAGDLADVEGALKVNYDKEVHTLMPDECILQEKLEFGRKELSAAGRSFNFPILAKNEWGLTLLGTSGAAADLNAASNAEIEEASVKPYESWFYGRQSFTAAQRGSEAGKKSFVDMTTFKMKNLMTQHRRVTEIQLLHGTEDIGEVDSLSSQVITLKARTSSPAMLSLLEGATLDVYQSNGSTLRQGDLVVDEGGVDLSPSDGKYTITVTGTTTGIVSGDRIYLNGATSSLTGNEMPGLNRLAALTTGTVWGINVANRTLLKGNSVTAFGLATVAKILKQHVKTANRGGTGEYWLIVAPDVYQNLANDESAKQMFDSSYSENKFKTGAKSLELYTTTGQKLVLVGHPFQKEETFCMVEKSNIIRVGSSDHTMKVGNQELVRWKGGSNYAEFGSFTDQCVVLTAPSHNLSAVGASIA
jgi:hypothetical protein